MTLDLVTVAPIVAFVLSVITLGTQVKAILSSGEKQLDERLKKAEEKLVEYDRRIQTVEGEIKHLPTRDAQHQIEISLEKINGRLDTLAESLKPIKHNGEMLNDLLREQVKAAANK